MKNKKSKKLNNLKLRTKTVGAFIVIALMLIIGVTPVLAGTVTINDTGITISDSDFTLSFASDNITTDNVSAGNVTVSGDFIGGNVANWDTAYGWGDHSGEGYLTAYGDPWFNSSDTYHITSALMTEWNTSYDERGSQIAGENLTWSGSQLNSKYHNCTYIWNSNDNHYPATETGLQDAIDNIDNESGSWVDGGGNNISISKILKVGTGEFRNFRLYLADNADCTMIMNYDLTNGNNDIYIHHVTLDGNGENQPWKNSTDVDIWDHEPCGIFLINCDDVTIRDVNISYTQFLGLVIQQGKRPVVDNVRVSYAGDWLDNVPYTPSDCYSASGIFMYNSTECIVTNCHVFDVWAAGIIIESTLPSYNPYRCYYSSVSNCVVVNSTIAFYCEDAENVSFINCVSNDTMLKNTAYSLDVGFLAKTINTRNIKFIGCSTSNSYYGFSVGGNGSEIVSCTARYVHKGIICAANYSSVVNNKVIYGTNIGISYTGRDGDVSGNTINNCLEGIRISASNTSVYRNHINNCTDLWGNGIVLSSADNCTFLGNYIIGDGGYYPNTGFYGGNTDVNCRILFNTISGIANDILQCNAQVNCTGDNWNYLL